MPELTLSESSANTRKRQGCQKENHGYHDENDKKLKAGKTAILTGGGSHKG